MVSGGLKKIGPEISISFNSGVEEKKRKYEDTFPEALPDIEAAKEKYGVVVWCKYVKCKYNAEVEDLQRTSGTLLKSAAYKPIAEQEAIWPFICTRGEIAIKFDEIRGKGGSKTKVPS